MVHAYVFYSDPLSAESLTDIYDTLTAQPQSDEPANSNGARGESGDWNPLEFRFDGHVFTLETGSDAPGIPDVSVVQIWLDTALFRLTRPDDELEAHATVLLDVLEAFYEASLEAGTDPLAVLVPNSTDQEHIERNPERIDLTADDLRNGRLTFLSWIQLLPPHYSEPIDADRFPEAPAWRKRALSDGAMLFAFRPTPHRVTEEFIQAEEYFGFDD